MLQLLKSAHLEPVLLNKRSHLNEKPEHCKEDPVQQNINKNNVEKIIYEKSKNQAGHTT